MSLIKSLIQATPLRRVYESLNNQFERDKFVVGELRKLRPGSLILDAGCGNQRYRKDCAHLDYKSQDFGQYVSDEKKTIWSDGVGGTEGYQYGELDYVGDIWNVEAPDGTFDAIICTEVFEHIPFPCETIKEFSRLLKKGGLLILTAPSNCLRHMDPYFFYSGFSDRWYEKFLRDNGMQIVSMTAVADYYRWIAVEMARTARSNSIVAKIALAPAFLYFYSKKRTQESVDTLCMGYHVVALKP